MWASEAKVPHRREELCGVLWCSSEGCLKGKRKGVWRKAEAQRKKRTLGIIKPERSHGEPKCGSRRLNSNKSESRFFNDCYFKLESRAEESRRILDCLPQPHALVTYAASLGALVGNTLETEGRARLGHETDMGKALHSATHNSPKPTASLACLSLCLPSVKWEHGCHIKGLVWRQNKRRCARPLPRSTDHSRPRSMAPHLPFPLPWQQTTLKLF